VTLLVSNSRSVNVWVSDFASSRRCHQSCLSIRGVWWHASGGILPGIFIIPNNDVSSQELCSLGWLRVVNIDSNSYVTPTAFHNRLVILILTTAPRVGSSFVQICVSMETKLGFNENGEGSSNFITLAWILSSQPRILYHCMKHFLCIMATERNLRL
jgi:hypothetical protein